jgi:hypothetical protein
MLLRKPASWKAGKGLELSRPGVTGEPRGERKFRGRIACMIQLTDALKRNKMPQKVMYIMELMKAA